MEKRTNLHYNGKAGEIITRKNFSSTASHVDAIESGGVNQIFFKSRFVADNQHTLAYFERVVKHLSGAKGKELKRLKEEILATEENHEYSTLHHFSDEDLYRVLLTNPICKKACEKRKLYNWQEIIATID